MDSDALKRYYKEIGARLRSERAVAGLSQAQVAEHLGLTRASIANAEAGRQRLLVHQIAVLADLFGKSIADLAPAIESQPSDPLADLHDSLYIRLVAVAEQGSHGRTG